jgi:hypothetical protein
VQAQTRPTSRVLRRHCRVLPQRRVIGSFLPFLFRSVHARGRTPNVTGGGCASGYRGFTRGWDPKKSSEEFASKLANQTPDGGRIAQRISLALRSRPRPRAVVFPTLRLGDGRASSAELRHLAGKPERGRVLQLESPLAWRQLPEPLRGFLLRAFHRGVRLQAVGQRGGKPFAEVTRRLPHAGCPPKWVPRRKTRSGNTMTPPMGFVSFRRGKHR